MLSSPDATLAYVGPPRRLAWLLDAPASARRGLLAASLGWMLDAFDVMLYAMVLVAVMQEFGLSKGMAGLLGSLTLAASAVGGVVFGLIADARGRRAAMMLSILTYSIFTAACAFVTSVWQLALFRFVLGLGMGGEWTSGAALVSESWPDAHRGKAIGLMQSAWALGYAAAAIVAAVVMPRFGWRGTFLVGIVPALLVMWVRRHVEESPVWVAHGRGTRRTPLAAVLRRPLLTSTLALSALSLFTLFAYWALNLWMAAYLSLPPAQGGLGLMPSTVTALVVSMQVGTWLGYVSFGYFSDAIGRRASFVLYLTIGAVLVFVYGRTFEPRLLFAIGPLASFFGTGHLAGFGVITAEMYPTAVRATAQGLTFNIGRIGSALAPFTVGSLAQTQGFGPAFSITAASLVAAAVVWFWLPETRGRCLQ